jgi:hypothetical protein
MRVAGIEVVGRVDQDPPLPLQSSTACGTSGHITASMTMSAAAASFLSRRTPRRRDPARPR